MRIDKIIIETILDNNYKKEIIKIMYVMYKTTMLKIKKIWLRLRGLHHLQHLNLPRLLNNKSKIIVKIKDIMHPLEIFQIIHLA